MNNRIYLDYNASAPLRPKCRDLMMAVLDAPHNASSVHGFGRAGRSFVEAARDQVAALVNVPASQVIFNSGATEANNTVLKHFAPEGVVVSATEHLSVLEALDGVKTIPVTVQGVVDLEGLEALLNAEKPALVSVMIVNNETGVIQPIKEISDIVHRNGALLHCDGVQAAGRITIDMAAMGVDFLSLSAHKIGGPQGVGALALGFCGVTPTLLYGGGQEKKARAGTENVAGIAAFGLAAELAKAQIEKFQELEILRDAFETQLLEISPNVIIHGKETARVANTSMFSLPGASAETLMMAMDLEGIAVSNGSACSSGTVRSSYVLEAMGHGPEISTSALRISMGWNSAQSDLDAFLTAWTKLYNRLKDKEKISA